MGVLNCLTSMQKEALENILQVCRTKDIKCYMVGGAVRDALLNTSPRDIDICIDEDPAEIISHLELEDYLYHSDFQTSTVRFKSGVEFDVIRCRTEMYKFPGALPSVSPSSLYEDLKRRDFTINAIAYDLMENKIVDPFHGIKDIKDKRIRSVHQNSYEEDPTRIFRAAKYGCRYDFFLYDTEEIKKCINKNILESISNDRYIKEIVSICHEEKWEDMLSLCSSLGLFELAEGGIKSVLADLLLPEIRFLNFSYRIKNGEAANKIIDNSIVKKEIRKAVYNYKKAGIPQQLYLSRDNYEIYEILKKSSHFDRVMLCFDYKLTYKVLDYMMLCRMKSELDGNYIKNAANIEGPALGKLFEHIKRIKLNAGIADEKKYFKDNLGEIIDAIEYKA